MESDQPRDDRPQTPGEEPAGETREQPTQATQPQTTSPPPPRRLLRSRDDRILGGVAGGLGRYFAVDPIFFRIGFAATLFLGGLGILVYLAAWLLVPEEDTSSPGAQGAPGAVPTAAPRSPGQRQALTILGIVLAVIIGGPLLLAAIALVLGGGLLLGALVIPFALLVLAGLAVWWLASGQRPQGTREVLRAALLGLGILLVATIVAMAGFWAAAVGGGTVMAALVIAAGAVLAIGAFFGGVRWLIFPALALALSVGFVAAADIDLDGGIGEREYRPVSATDLRDRYELGMGRLVVDLRGADLPAGDTPLKLRLGIGQAVVLVPDDVCVASRAEVGMGVVNFFDRENGGVDVSWEDTPHPRSKVKRLVLDADVGVGQVGIGYREPDRDGWGRDRRFFNGRGDNYWGDGGVSNRACAAKA
jgi:phage shock protein PspC (stress-responsive transcriptional regulator)